MGAEVNKFSEQSIEAASRLDAASQSLMSAAVRVQRYMETRGWLTRKQYPGTRPPVRPERAVQEVLSTELVVPFGDVLLGSAAKEEAEEEDDDAEEE